jgi:hypothetical protein
MRRIAIRLGIAVAAFAAILAGAGYELTAAYTYEAPKPDYLKPSSLAEAQRDDLDYLKKLPDADWSYTPETRAKAEQAIDDTRKGRLPLDPATFELTVARIVALSDNGHTNVWNAERANRVNRVPVRTFSFADGVFIVRALPIATDLLGAQILAVDGVAIADVAKTVAVYTGGTAEAKNLRLPFYVESPALLHAAGIAKASDSLVYTLRMPDGSVVSRKLAALPPDTKSPELWPQTQMSPTAIPGQSRTWVPALKGKADHMLLFAADPEPFFDTALPGQRAYYIRFDVNHDEPGMLIGKFADAAFARIVAARPTIVVVDLRFNGGGDYTTTAHFMRDLPEKLPQSRFYILTSQETFSAGITSAAFLKQAAGDRGLFVGSVVGDRMRFNAEGGDFCLPFSHICMGVRTAIHDYSQSPCRPFLICYPLDLLYPVQIKSFGPDIQAPLTYKALSQGHDPALDAIFAREQKASSTGKL